MGGRARWWKYTGSQPLAAFVLACVCIGGLMEEGAALYGTRPLGAAELASPPIGRYVDVACDDVDEAGTFDNGRHAYLCAIGDRVLPVVGTRAVDDGTDRFTGRLREFRDRDAHGRSDTGDQDFIWPEQVRTDPAVARAYLEVETLTEGRVLSVVAILAGLGAIVIGLRWWRARRRAA